jgi:UDP-N-acetylmuramoyl-tripeptide--D-alanyl-D-alanine ligase
MEARSLDYVVQACDGERLSGSPGTRVLRVCTDSRQAQAGDLFFALTGERFDGHKFLAEVAAKGAAAVVVQRGRTIPELGNCAVIAVEDSRRALGRLAERYRRDFSLPLIAIAGSNGKTTTKELFASVLRQGLSTLSSEASFNNDIGVPMTLLKIEQGHQAAVLEAGTNHPGELEPLIRMIRPKFGVITCIGREHLEFFGDTGGVAKEEGWLAELLPADGKLFLHGDTEWADQIASRTRAEVSRVGFSEHNDWRVHAVRTEKQGVAFCIDAPRADVAGEYKIQLLGRHQALNAAFAVAAAAELGLTRSQITAGLAQCQAPKMRLQLSEWNGVRVLDDAYNANADSTLAALQTLHDLPCRGRRVAVLGDMAELGGQTEAAHEEVGRRAAELGTGQLFAVGTMAAATARGARNAGLNRVLEFQEVETAAAAVKSFVRSGDLVLLKASRSARLERVAELLRAAKSEKRIECSIF